MPRIEDLDPESQEFLQNYQCRPGVDNPWTPLEKPLSRCKVALITSSGLIRKSDQPFDLGNPNGDPSYRVIPSTTSGTPIGGSPASVVGLSAERKIGSPMLMVAAVATELPQMAPKAAPT